MCARGQSVDNCNEYFGPTSCYQTFLTALVQQIGPANRLVRPGANPSNNAKHFRRLIVACA
jgi:hypothetical protein